MITIDHTVISDDIKDRFFICDLKKCKGKCCVEGDLGAPLAEEELSIIASIYEVVAPYLTTKGKEVIEKEGVYVKDHEGDFSTPVINGRECAYAVYDEKGILKCGFELACQEGKTNFKKPISCHLYPLRITKYANYEAINYHQWHICNPACKLGEKHGMILAEFLKEALIRKYDETWYEKLMGEIRQGDTTSEV